MVKAKFAVMCPNCGGPIDADRLASRLPCEICLPNLVKPEEVCSALTKLGKLKGLATSCMLKADAKDFADLFKKCVGSKPWSLQLTWAKRVLRKRSFAMIAPTGVGKTTFGLVMACFLEGKSYILVPTRILVEQVSSRLRSWTDKKIVAYTGRESKEELKNQKQAISEGNFDILVTTNVFLHKNYELLKDKVFNFVFVDDVDSLLKASKNVDRILTLIGFKPDVIEIALKRSRSYEEQRTLDMVKSNINSVLVVSSATTKPRGKRIRLFRELLNFDVQRANVIVRNIVDLREKFEGDFDKLVNRSLNIVKKLGKGALLFVSADKGREAVQKVLESFRSNGIRAISYEDFNEESKEDFIRGHIEAIVGISHSQNPLARGIDLPQAVRYVIFLGVPKMLFKAEPSRDPLKLLRLMIGLRPIMHDKERADRFISSLRKYVGIRQEQLQKYKGALRVIDEAYSFVTEFISRPDFYEILKSSKEISLVEKEEGLFLAIGDAAAYIQASGRASRLYAGGLTLGVSYMISEDPKAERSLIQRLKFIYPEIEFKAPSEVNIDYLMKNVDDDRERVKRIMAGKIEEKDIEILKTALVVVESPTKAKTIAKFFGKPAVRVVGGIPVYETTIGNISLTITASLGHITDLVTKEGIYGVEKQDGSLVPVFTTIKRCPYGDEFTDNACKHVEMELTDKLSIVKALREIAEEVDEVYVATDPDSEGEKIAWDVALSLLPYNPRVRRAEFHEVTRHAFLKALESPREINDNLVKAQLVRRIADRWVGFYLSQRVQVAFKHHHLSAGRVQTPVLGWVIEKEKVRKKKKVLITANLDSLPLRFEIADEELGKNVYENLERLRFYVVGRRERKVNPQPPHTTDSLLAEASEKLHMSAQETMQVAQELFELGLITYHRTDSPRVSEAGMRVAREYITDQFGERVFKARVWSEEGAHECIRPTRPLDRDGIRLLFSQGLLESRNPERLLRVYDLIFKRFIASQMKESMVDYADVVYELDGFKHEDSIPLRVIEEGFTLISPIRTFSLPSKVKVTDKSISLVPMEFPYTQGALIHEMKRRRIGRPSTYATIVQTLLERGYVTERRNFLRPTHLGYRVYYYLKKRYPSYSDEDFTRVLEDKMELVEHGLVSPEEVISDLMKAGIDVQ